MSTTRLKAVGTLYEYAVELGIDSNESSPVDGPDVQEGNDHDDLADVNGVEPIVIVLFMFFGLGIGIVIMQLLSIVGTTCPIPNSLHNIIIFLVLLFPISMSLRL